MAEYNFKELIQDIALRKQQAVKTRFYKQDNVAENPREVYLDVCQKIADFFEPYGFKYAGSKQTLTLKRKDLGLQFRISFHSSHYNSAGTNVEVQVFANVSSPDFKKWTEKQCLNVRCSKYYGFIGAGSIGNLQEPSRYFSWNVANPETRGKEVEDIIDHINKFAITYFQKFEDIPAIVSILEKEGRFPGIGSMTDIAEFLLYYASKESVEKAFSSFLTIRKAWDEYKKIYEKGLERPDSTYWAEIAYLTKKLDLKLNR